MGFTHTHTHTQVLPKIRNSKMCFSNNFIFSFILIFFPTTFPFFPWARMVDYLSIFVYFWTHILLFLSCILTIIFFSIFKIVQLSLFFFLKHFFTFLNLSQILKLNNLPNLYEYLTCPAFLNLACYANYI